MELPDLGDHCSLKDCSRLDFLPFGCDACGLTFCLDHRNPEAHSCQRSVANKKKGEEEEKKKKEEELGEENDGDATKPEKISYRCSFAKVNCQKKELTSVICPKCRLSFCLAHRHPPDHDCAIFREEEKLKWERENKKNPSSKTAAAAAAKTTPSSPNVLLLRRRPQPLRNDKARQTAAKVALMKMKLRAEGDESVPQTERVYFRVAMPKTGFHSREEEAGREQQQQLQQQQQQPKDSPMFFCERWSLGRAIDFVASKRNLRNANNVASARKLRLFRHEDGAPLTTDLGKTVKQVVDEKVVFSGSPLVLEYVDPEEEEEDDDGNAAVDPKLYPL